VRKYRTVEAFFTAVQESGIVDWKSADGMQSYICGRDGEKNEAWVREHGARAGGDWVPAGIRVPVEVRSEAEVVAETRLYGGSPEWCRGGGGVPPHLGGDGTSENPICY
jgi:hypothetical protein